MYDLIYIENRSDYLKSQKELKQKFPSAKFEDASDDIHRDRFAIKLNDISDKDYHLGLLDLGLALCSLNFQLFLREKTQEAKKLIDKWIINSKPKGV